jgi:CheY-like chemotaxis protein
MSKRILVVEDQPDNRQIIRDMLAPTDYEIAEAENGEEALEAIAKQRPDLILMDIQLPVMDAYEATRRIKADARCAQSRSSQSRLMRSVAKDRRREWPAAMTLCRSLLARAIFWRRFGNTCNNRRHISCNGHQIAARARARAWLDGPGYSILASVGKLLRHAGPERVASNP